MVVALQQKGRLRPPPTFFGTHMSRTDAQRLRDWRKANPERVKELEVHSTARVRAWRAANPERAKASRKRYDAEYAARVGVTPRKSREKSYFKNNTVKALLREARRRAKRKGWDFNLDDSDIVIPDRCPVFGTPITLDKPINQINPDAPSVDRIKSGMGYVKGNICVISHRANILKGSLTLEECEAIAAYIRRVSAEAAEG